MVVRDCFSKKRINIEKKRTAMYLHLRTGAETNPGDQSSTEAISSHCHHQNFYSVRSPLLGFVLKVRASGNRGPTPLTNDLDDDLFAPEWRRECEAALTARKELRTEFVDYKGRCCAYMYTYFG